MYVKDIDTENHYQVSLGYKKAEDNTRQLKNNYPIGSTFLLGRVSTKFSAFRPHPAGC